MRTEQADAYRRSVGTRVVEIQREGDAVWVVLEDTLLYPTSGGQSNDEGWIRPLERGDTLHVVDVALRADGTVRHRVGDDVPSGAPLSVGTEVEVTVDWPRRYRHMQRHSAQHLFSQAFLHVDSRFETASVSLTSEECTVDLEGDPDSDAIDAAVDQALTWGYLAMPIDAFEIDEDEVQRWPLRRPPKVRGKIRLVRMGDVELSACGGTHVACTAEVLPLVALGHKRIRGGLTRVTFVAGVEAARYARRRVSDVIELARTFSARPDDVVARIHALQADLADAKRDATVQRDRWARAIVASSDQDAILTFHEDDLLAAAALTEAAAALRPDAVVIVGSVTGDRAHVTIQAGPASVDVDVRPALRAAMDVLGGRGGGKRDHARGSGPHVAALAEAMEAAVATCRS